MYTCLYVPVYGWPVPTPRDQVRTLGDDIVWMHVGEDGQLRGINPENGTCERRSILKLV